jgi:hypothetical protein
MTTIFAVAASVPNNQLIATFGYLFDWIGDYSFFDYVDWLFNCQLIGQKNREKGDFQGEPALELLDTVTAVWIGLK